MEYESIYKYLVESKTELIIAGVALFVGWGYVADRYDNYKSYRASAKESGDNTNSKKINFYNFSKDSLEEILGITMFSVEQIFTKISKLKFPKK